MATSGKLAELYVDLIANDKLGPAIQNAKDIISRTQSELSQISTVAGQQRLKEFVTTNKQMAAEQEKLRRTMDIAINGRFNVFMKDMRDGINKAAEALAGFGMGPMGTVIAGLGVMNAMQQASPDIWNTFTGSVNYAAAGLGTALMPMLIELSQWLQGVARWFLNLDDGTKAMIGGFVKWAAIIGVVGFALSKIIGIIQGVSNALRLLAMANPWLLLLAGLGALIGIAIGASSSRDIFEPSGSEARSINEGRASPRGISERRSSIAERAIDSLHENASQIHREAASNLEFTTTTLRQIVGRGLMNSPDMAPILARMDRSGSFTPEDIAEISALIRSHAETSSREAIARNTLNRYARGGLGDGPERDAVTQLTDATSVVPSLARLLPADIIARRLSEVAPSLPPSVARLLPTPTTESPGTGGPGLLHDAHFQSQFLGIEQQWLTMQQGAASMTPLQAEMMAIQREQRDRLISLDTNIDRRLPRPAS